MKSNWKAILFLTVAVGFSATVADAAILFKDNFDVADSGSFDAADLTGRRSGPVGSETNLQSFGAQQSIVGGNLELKGAGGVRFGGETARYNWAGATTGADILAAGGFQVTFDWTHIAGSPEWVALKVGTPNGDSNVNAASVDHAMLIRQNENIAGQWTERWDNGVATGGTISYSPIPNLNTYPVVLTYSFNSFADGSPVNLSAVVNGIEVANDNFTWDGNGGALHFELASGVQQLVDNFTVSTRPDVIPEPSTIVLLTLAGTALLVRNRK
jgi:hypothetical protein